MVATLVRLRWRLTLNSLRANVWALIGTIVGALYGLGLLLALVAGAIGLGRLGADAAAPVLAAAGAHARVSSSLVKDVAGHGGDVSGLVPGVVLAALERELAPAARRPAGRP